LRPKSISYFRGFVAIRYTA